MNVLKDEYGDEHQQSIKDIDVRLMLHQIPVVSLKILNHTNHRTNQNQNARDVESNHVASPQVFQLDGPGCGCFVHTCVKDDGTDREQTEEDDLHEETTNDDVFAGGRSIRARDEDSGTYRPRKQVSTDHNESTIYSGQSDVEILHTRCLHEEREHITADKDFGQPPNSDQRELLCIKHLDDASESHVDTGSQESGRDQDQGTLHDVGALGVVGCLERSEQASNVTDRFHCEGDVFCVSFRLGLTERWEKAR